MAGDEASDLFGDETGLPMIQCPECKRERVIERWSKKQNENLGRVYVKCPMDSGVSGCVFIPLFLVSLIAMSCIFMVFAFF